MFFPKLHTVTFLVGTYEGIREESLSITIISSTYGHAANSAKNAIVICGQRHIVGIITVYFISCLRLFEHF